MMDIGTWIQLAIAIATFLAVVVALYGLIDNSAKFRKQFEQARSIEQETQYAQYRPILTPLSDDLRLHEGQLDSKISELPLELVNLGTGVALNTWGVLATPKCNPLRSYSFSNQLPLIQGKETEVWFRFGSFLFTENDRIGEYDFMPPIELTSNNSSASILRYAARLTLTYRDVFGLKHATIYDLTDRNEWKFVAACHVLHDLEDMSKARQGVA